MRHFSSYATKDITELSLALALALKDIFVEETTVEVIKNRYNHTIFKSNFNYTTLDEMGNEFNYDPFSNNIQELGAGYLGGVFCNELPLFHIPYITLFELLPDLDYYTEANPLISVVLTDYLTYYLNAEQQWAALYRKPVEHIAQNFVSLALLVETKLPELKNAYNSLLNDVQVVKEDFIAEQIWVDQYREPVKSLTQTYTELIKAIKEKIVELNNTYDCFELPPHLLEKEYVDNRPIIKLLDVQIPILTTIYNSLLDAVNAEMKQFTTTELVVTNYNNPLEYLVQNHVSLARLVEVKLRELNNAYSSLVDLITTQEYDEQLSALIYEKLTMLSNTNSYLVDTVNIAKENFIVSFCNDRDNVTLFKAGSLVSNISALYAEKLYELKGLAAENKLIQDFIDRPIVQEALNDVLISIGRVLGNTIKIESEVAEASLLAHKGYDVYHVSVTKNKLILRNVGDYRILHWELNK